MVDVCGVLYGLLNDFIVIETRYIIAVTLVPTHLFVITRFSGTLKFFLNHDLSKNIKIE
jgi:hypothetical protein